MSPSRWVDTSAQHHQAAPKLSGIGRNTGCPEQAGCSSIAPSTCLHHMCVTCTLSAAGAARLHGSALCGAEAPTTPSSACDSTYRKTIRQRNRCCCSSRSSGGRGSRTSCCSSSTPSSTGALGPTHSRGGSWLQRPAVLSPLSCPSPCQLGSSSTRGCWWAHLCTAASPARGCREACAGGQVWRRCQQWSTAGVAAAPAAALQGALVSSCHCGPQGGHGSMCCTAACMVLLLDPTHLCSVHVHVCQLHAHEEPPALLSTRVTVPHVLHRHSAPAVLPSFCLTFPTHPTWPDTHCAPYAQPQSARVSCNSTYVPDPRLSLMPMVPCMLCRHTWSWVSHSCWRWQGY